MINPSKIWSSSQLPSLPVVAVKLLDLSRSPETEIKDVIEVIRADPAISAKILKATNSTFFGFSAKVVSVDRAVPLLGTTVVTSLALSFSLVEAAMTSGPAAEHYSDYWKQSIVHSAAAESLSQYSEKGLACEFFLAGLLMDIGRLAMLKTISEQYLPVLKTARDDVRDLTEVELQVLGFDHTQIGFELMRNWNLPESLSTAVKQHHAGLDQLTALQDDPDYSLVQAIAVAASIGDYFCRSNKGQALERLRSLTSSFYKLSETDLQELLVQIKARIDQTAELFATNMADLGDPADLMAQANEQLSQLAMRAHVASTMAVARQQIVEQEKQDLQSKNEELQKQALHDALTRIYNRKFFDETLAKEVHRCARTASALGIIFLDVDRFKQLNDNYGHQFGDAVLKRVAAAVGEVLRSADTFARYGGEEFVILANQPTEKGMQKLAERIRARVEAEQLAFEDKPVPVTVSVGAAIAIPARNDTDFGARVVEAADQAMYAAKQSGRNRVCTNHLLNENDRRLLQSVMNRRFSRWLVNRGTLDIAGASKALLQCEMPQQLIGDIARQFRLIDDVQTEIILQVQSKDGGRFGETAIGLGYIDEPQLFELLALQQEDPLVLASTLIRLGLLDVTTAQNSLREYRAESVLRKSAAVAAS